MYLRTSGEPAIEPPSLAYQYEMTSSTVELTVWR